MKKPKFLVSPLTKADKKNAKIFQKILDHEWGSKGDIVNAITLARMYISKVYGIETPESIWDRILMEVYKYDYLSDPSTKEEI